MHVPQGRVRHSNSVLMLLCETEHSCMCSCPLACDPWPTQKLCVTSYSFTWFGVGKDAYRKFYMIRGPPFLVFVILGRRFAPVFALVSIVSMVGSAHSCFSQLRCLWLQVEHRSWLEAVSCVGHLAGRLLSVLLTVAKASSWLCSV